jgi:hypothetical protein
VFEAGGASPAICRMTGIASTAVNKTSLGGGRIDVIGTLILDNCDRQVLTGYAIDITVTNNCTNSSFFGKSQNAPAFTGGATRYSASNANNTHIITQHVQYAGPATTNGSRTLPDGRIEYWGESVTASGSVAVNFPAAFTLAVEQLEITCIDAPPAGQLHAITAVPIGLSGFTAYGRTQNGAATADTTLSFKWRAVGV